jgi:hypothetical protein
MNIPGFIRPLLYAVMEEKQQSPYKLFADAISCFKMMPLKKIKNHGGSGLDLVCFLVELEKSRTASIINTYQINGIDFPFNTINSLHYKFISKGIKLTCY